MYPFMQENKKIYSQLSEIDKDNKHYLDIIIDKSDNYLKEIFSDKEYEKSKCPIIYGKRISREGESLFKKITVSIFYRFINLLSEIQFPVDMGDFRLIDKTVIEAYKSFSENPKYIED